jgi:outer membrane protein OmpA-like peptidoglycan-associated protein
MNPTPFRRFTASMLLAWGCVAIAQDTPASLETEKKQLQLERQKLDLEAQQLELQRKQLESKKTAAELWAMCERLSGVQRKLEMEEAARKELQLQETDKTITMKLEGDVLFDFGKAEIKPEAEKTLDKVGTVVLQFPDGKVLIEGHTDSKGLPKVNLELSKRRAEAVKAWLVKNKGIPDSSITTEGFGEVNPVAPNINPDGSDNPQGREQNRSVEIIVEKA